MPLYIYAYALLVSCENKTVLWLDLQTSKEYELIAVIQAIFILQSTVLTACMTCCNKLKLFIFSANINCGFCMIISQIFMNDTGLLVFSLEMYHAS